MTTGTFKMQTKTTNSKLKTQKNPNSSKDSEDETRKCSFQFHHGHQWRCSTASSNVAMFLLLFCFHSKVLLTIQLSLNIYTFKSHGTDKIKFSRPLNHLCPCDFQSANCPPKCHSKWKKNWPRKRERSRGKMREKSVWTLGYSSAQPMPG